ncbi:TetR/AcrR family transcriptional regulator [Endozoicomonas sp. SM1973]|uniref:TetR/AcrR family transcriptional regulator n=1 Tax=Spartinivicinus marinus TaxID=2994442 RepID=A0A853IEU2_9GAMM|nr:TetR/AcrR family transcriptional regulator [Spartinivicinus marinus]MCX4027811.1 TetR/AcrR family transcriptional regulator [Spartinivicinus marinus]NYZ69048.1 TetR/AcrR family transcriptional regulator [Spartinivicinus marinus]
MTRSEHQDTRETILNAGEQLILSKGFSAVGLAQILTQANVPKGSFYHYFRSKEQFGVELLKRYFDDYNKLLKDLFAQPEKTGKQLLMEYWQRWFENQAAICCDRQCMAVKLSAEVSDLSDDMRLILKSGIDSVIQKIAACIERGVNDGSLSEHLDPHYTAFTLYQQWMGASLITKVRRDKSAITNAMALTECILTK